MQCKFHDIPSRELTYPQKWHFEDDFPLSKVGYVSALEGMILAYIVIYLYFYYAYKFMINDNDTFIMR